MGLNSAYADQIRKIAAGSADMSDQEFLSRVLTCASVWRSKLWANTIVRNGTEIRSGPFKGMDYLVKSSEGALLPRMLGIYERELHPDLLAFADDDLETIIDIGCAEGYYAVGLARLMPGVKVHAFDIDPVAQRRCALLAEANGVGDRVIVSGAFTGDAFESFRGGRSLVICDAEGFEDDLFRPDLYPALAELNIIVETHPMLKPGITDRLVERFSTTHHVKRIDPEVRAADLPPEIMSAAHLDMTLACWEWRAGPTPWLVMRPKTHPDQV